MAGDPTSSESISRKFLERIFDRQLEAGGPTTKSVPPHFQETTTPRPGFDSATLPSSSYGMNVPNAVPNEGSHSFQSIPVASSVDALPAPVAAAVARLGNSNDPHSIAPERIKTVIEELQNRSNEAMRAKLGKSLNTTIPGTAPGDKAFVPNIEAEEFASRNATALSRAADVQAIRADFPALHQSIHGRPLVWFDNAATTHKPRSVIDAVSRFYSKDYSNIHRAAHSLAARATDHYEAARETVRDFIGADSTNDIVFVRGTTEGINFIAQTCKSFLRQGDEILLTEMEHHANIVPWQMVAREVGAKIRVAPFNNRGELLMDEYRRLLGPRTKLVSVTHASNTLGTILPVEEMAALAHKHGARFAVDGAQSIAHIPVDVLELGCDYYVFSGHKVFAPTGIGVVYVHPDLHEMLPPWQGEAT